MTNIYDELPIVVLRSNRRTISIEIKMSGIFVRAPRHTSSQEISDFVLKKKAWVKKHWLRMQERQQVREQQGAYTAEELKALVEKALVVIPEKVRHYAPLVGVDYGRITIRNQRTRWGSCSSKGNLNFNCLLMLLPDDVIDSIVVHELCHRKHMNHSSQFYAEVERVFPDYKRCDQWLNKSGGMFLSRLRIRQKSL